MKKRSLLFALLLLLIVPMLLLCSCGEEELSSGELSVELNSSGKKLKITVMPDSKLLEEYEKEDLYLFSFAPGESPSDGFEGKTPIDQKSAKEKVKFKIPLTENGESRLYHSFAAAFYDEKTDGYVLATHSAAFVKNPYELSENNADFPKTDSIKGICAEYDTDAVNLGISHVIIDIPVEDYVLGEGNSKAVAHIFGRSTVFIDNEAIEELDGRIKYYTENGVVIYLRFTLKTSAEELPEGLKYLAYSGTAPGETSYALNMNDKDCAGAVTGLADFIAARYAVEEGEYGSVSAFIAGSGLNTPGSTSGDTDYDTYFEGAALLVRTLYTALASNYENGRVYVTVDHRWKVSGSGDADSSGFKFLTEFAKAAKEEGDYPWGVAVSVRSTTADSDRVWYDTSGDGTYISPSNLDAVSDDFLGSAKYYFDEEERHLIISDFSVEAGSGEDAEGDQAASYAYTYYKAVDAENVDAFIYSAQVDTEASRAGLRKLTDEGLPSAKRKIYSVIKDIDTDADITAIVENAISSSSDWDSLYNEHSETVMADKSTSDRGKIINIANDEDPLEGYKSDALYDFKTGDMLGFSTAGNGSYSGLTEKGLLVSFANPSSAEFGYIYKSDISKSDIKDDSVLIKLKDVSASCNITLTLIQRNEKKADVIYESTVEGVPSGGAVLLDFDISSFRDELKNGDIELRLSAVGDGELPCELIVEEILTGKAKTNTVLVVILIILASAAIVAIVVLVVIWFRKNYRIEFDRSSKKSKETKKNESPKKAVKSTVNDED